jgi:cyclophilin family peptidyl-prolyl cis-trans isomerase/HEAT repeat protein
MINATTPLLFLVIPALLSAQPTISENRSHVARQRKIEAILRTRDLRTPHDAGLIRALTDQDPIVRLKATLAYGTLQDSSVMGLLIRNLADPDSGIAEAAAFAIGQTGTRLSTRSRQNLEDELLRLHLPETAAPGRLIEEIGKFGTPSALDDLIIRVADVPPVHDPEGLCMSIARFATRGIASRAATQVVLRYIDQGPQVPWQAVYALQRIGDRPEIQARLETVRLLLRNPDPNVRMHAATLMGKLHDAGGSDASLQRLADGDADWRVRVNALRALASFTWKENAGVIETYRRSLFDENPYIALTAAALIPQIGIGPLDTLTASRETLRQLSLIAANRSSGFTWNLQAESASALALMTHDLPVSLFDERKTIYPQLHARLLQAAGESDDSAAVPLLTDALNDDDAIVVCGALNGLTRFVRRHPDDVLLRDRVFTAAVRVLGTSDVAVVAGVASLFGDSLMLRPEAVPPLLAALESMHPPDDTEALQEVISTLGKLGDTRAMDPLLDQLASPDPSIGAAAAEALRGITGNDYTARIPRRTEPLYVDLDFTYLRSLPARPRIRLATTRGDILIELNVDAAPFTIMSLLKLSEQRGFFRGLTFHRVVPNFVVQGGDPRGDGWGGPGYAVRSEFSPLTFGTGTVGMASAGKDTEGSQFFITQSPQPHLDGRYTIIGRVVEGMNVVNALQVGDRMYDFQRIE